MIYAKKVDGGYELYDTFAEIASQILGVSICERRINETCTKKVVRIQLLGINALRKKFRVEIC